MANSIALAFACLAIAGVFFRFTAIRKNAKIAESTGFKVFYSPVYMNETWWLFLHKFIVPFLELLPSPLTRPWLKTAQRWRLWHYSYEPFEEAGSDTIVMATPSVNMITTCDPVVINQIVSQPRKVQQDPKIMKLLAIWGDNITSTDGEEWKHHRRVVNAGFTPAIHAMVWEEASEQAQTLIDHWATLGSVVPVVKIWMSKLALHVVSATFFHKKLTWKEVDHVPTGHQMGFEQALNTVIRHLQPIALLKARLKWLPFKTTQEAYTAFSEWTAYMKELRQIVLDRLDETAKKPNKSLLESIVVAGATGEAKDALPEDHALGNLFLTALAGHETTANTMAFTILLLAVYPEWQRRVQEQLDQQFDGRERLQWSFDQDYQALQKGPVWAVLKESMRLYNVVQHLYRKTVAPTTLLDSQGVAHEVPAGTLCQFNLGAIWRNPNRWTSRTATDKRREKMRNCPALDFDPERWLSNSDLVNDQDLHVPRFFPFGQGPRQCPGERFAMVEMTSVFATVYKNYSVELVVSQEKLKACGGDKEAAWESAREGAIRTLSEDIVSNINLELWKELPIQIVKRHG
ncbi:hypothetical protein M409DRAFT_22092 [Zasmidium cellare ATCC 36951]|uniref:Cytochrome P450 n=1 Tax=Zasmidium cellare ATCC 36951 TaxID=1080233 RepID=A0A6A6CL24_ZASCE|nr:uncharacterized protein M409DRAFT_22092 [Zasmidium cellare ATCC 36951]KAF2167947.1 hypothetical protein M409DRAFT_22092 [Zasmidium cellare ATCC 36951]